MTCAIGHMQGVGGVMRGVGVCCCIVMMVSVIDLVDTSVLHILTL